MLEQVKALTTEYDMFPRGGKVLCAVSGGADSMCLLHLAWTMAEAGGFQVAAAHYHHGMRGEAADADAAFVETFCKERNIPCVVERGDVYGQAQRLGLGVEETGRRLRYEFLRRAAEELGCNRIATAHNADDNLLRDLHIDRIYDTYIDEDQLKECDETIHKICNYLEPRPYSSREFIWEMGKVGEVGHRPTRIRRRIHAVSHG